MIVLLGQFLLNYTIRVTLNTEFDPLPFVRVGIPMTRLTKMYDTSPESWVTGAVHRLPFMSIHIFDLL